MPKPAGRPNRSSGTHVHRAPRSSDRDVSEPTPLRENGSSPLEASVEAEEEFSPHFQPIHSLEDGSLLAAEVLIRWTPPNEDCVAPAGSGLARRTGLAGPLGRQVLDRAAELLEQWGEAAPARLHLNLGEADLGGGAAPATELRRAARESGLHPGRLCLEIGERQARASARQVRRLRELGAQVALDGFGAGYAAYSLLGELPVTDLKLDGSLVRSLDRSVRHRTVVRGIVELARDLGIRVVAEGVRTAAQARRLREAGCRVAQGFLFGEPQAPEDFERTLLTSTPRRSSGSSG